MARIENELMEQQVADSLLGPESLVATYADAGLAQRVEVPEATEQVEEAPESYFSDSMDDLNSYIAEQKNNRFVLGDDGWHAPSESGEQEQRRPAQQETEDDWRSRMLSQEEASELAGQQQAQQPQSVQQAIQELDSTIEQYQLNDPVIAKGLASELCEAFGTDLYQSGMNVEVLGSTMAKTVLSAARMYEANDGNVSNLAPIPAESAKAFTHDFLRSWGVDPRTVDVDAQALAQTVLGGALNFFSTFERMGGITDMARLNEPEAAVQFLTNFNRAFGIDSPVSREQALKVADAAGKYILGFLGKIQASHQQPRARQGQGSRTNTGRGRGQRERVPGRRIPGMKTNQDKDSPFNQANVDSAINEYTENRRYARL